MRGRRDPLLPKQTTWMNEGRLGPIWGLKATYRFVQQSGRDGRPEHSNEMSAAGERNLAAERRGRVECSGTDTLVTFHARD